MKLKIISPIFAAALVCAGCARHECPTTATTDVSRPAVTAPAMPVEKFVLKFVSVDSAETAGENGEGANAVDGNTNTIWHTQWQDATPECPHEIILELVPPATIKGFTYLPRQDENDHGRIKGYEFSTSNDGKTFSAAVAAGEFENNADRKTVNFAPVTCHFVKLKAVSEVNGEAWTSAAEIGVVQ